MVFGVDERGRSRAAIAWRGRIGERTLYRWIASGRHSDPGILQRGGSGAARAMGPVHIGRRRSESLVGGGRASDSAARSTARIPGAGHRPRVSAGRSNSIRSRSRPGSATTGSNWNRRRKSCPTSGTSAHVPSANSFDVGNPSLETETGLGVDVFGRITGRRLGAEVTWFRNSISEYVLPQATGRLGRVRLPIYQFVGEDAVMTGFESVFGCAMPAGRRVVAAAPYVHGTIRSTNEPLPFIPPLEGRPAVGYSPVDRFVEAEARMAGARSGRGSSSNRPMDARSLACRAACVSPSPGGCTS